MAFLSPNIRNIITLATSSRVGMSPPSCDYESRFKKLLWCLVIHRSREQNRAFRNPTWYNFFDAPTQPSTSTTKYCMINCTESSVQTIVPTTAPLPSLSSSSATKEGSLKLPSHLDDHQRASDSYGYPLHWYFLKQYGSTQRQLTHHSPKRTLHRGTERQTSLELAIGKLLVIS